MKKVEATIRQGKLVEVKNALQEMGVEGMTITAVHQVGGETRTMTYRGVKRVIDVTPSVRIEAIVADHKVEAVVGAIVQYARTGAADDGTIAVSNLNRVIRIRTGETDATDSENCHDLRPTVAVSTEPSRWDIPSYQHSW